jgi:hypothetical protein
MSNYRDEQNDSDDFDAHIDHDGYVEGCHQCDLEREAGDLALEAEAAETIDALISIFVLEPTDDDRQAARQACSDDPFATTYAMRLL